jgi:hypothetical protein
MSSSSKNDPTGHSLQVSFPLLTFILSRIVILTVFFLFAFFAVVDHVGDASNFIESQFVGRHCFSAQFLRAVQHCSVCFEFWPGIPDYFVPW